MRITTSPLLLLAPTLVSGIISFRSANRLDASKISNILHYLGDQIIGNNVESEGIFRVSPNQNQLERVMSDLKRGDLTSPSLKETLSSDPYLAPAAFKKSMGLIPGKLFSYDVFSQFKSDMDAIPTIGKQVEASMEGKEQTEIEDAKKKFVEAKTKAALDRAVASLDQERLEILRYIFYVMREVSSHAEKNMMGVDNLLLMFAPNMVSTDPNDTPAQRGKGIQVKLFAKKSGSRGSQAGAGSSATDPTTVMKNLEMAQQLIRLLFQVYPETVADFSSPSESSSPSLSFSSSSSR